MKKSVFKVALNSIATMVFLVTVGMPAAEVFVAVVTFDVFLLIQSEIIDEFRR